MSKMCSECAELADNYVLQTTYQNKLHTHVGPNHHSVIERNPVGQPTTNAKKSNPAQPMDGPNPRPSLITAHTSRTSVLIVIILLVYIIVLDLVIIYMTTIRILRRHHLLI